MSQSFNKIIELIKNDEMSWYKNLSPEDSKNVVKMFESDYSQAICFDGGNCDDFIDFKVIDEIAILPYPVCWIEFEGKNKTGKKLLVGGLLSGKDTILNGLVFLNIDNIWRFQFAFNTNNIKGKTVFGLLPDEHIENEGLSQIVALFRIFLTALNCKNVEQVENIPDAKLQKARIKRGKLPLFSYWTLHVDLNRDPTKNPKNGGTHASPRLHLRRGHPRQYSPGKYCWVSACAVGNKKAGMIHKDYAVKMAA